MVGIIRFIAIFLLFASLLGCNEEIVPKPYLPRNDHDAYRLALEQADLLSSALGSDWLKKGTFALERAIKVQMPYQEAFYFDPSQAESTGYRFEVRRGQKIEVIINYLSTDSLNLFIDLYRINNDSLKLYSHVASADSSKRKLAFEPRRDAEYILRVQPELLRGGRFEVTIIKVPSFTFPVSGKDSKAIGSFFGDPRDGGKRDHHGVDIFAPRHTPIIAPVRAYVRSVTTRGLGGRIVWLRDGKGRNIYFAHLETQLAQPRTYVNPGDTIGTVGNTGNAINTPPHLHFGIYQRGPLDPIAFIKETNTIFHSAEIRDEVLGTWLRSSEKVYMEHPNFENQLELINLHQPMKILAIVGSNHRVQLANGRIGYIANAKTEPVQDPLFNKKTIQNIQLLETPINNSTVKENIASGEELIVLAKQDSFWFVRTSNGSLGWVQFET